MFYPKGDTGPCIGRRRTVSGGKDLGRPRIALVSPRSLDARRATVPHVVHAITAALYGDVRGRPPRRRATAAQRYGRCRERLAFALAHQLRDKFGKVAQSIGVDSGMAEASMGASRKQPCGSETL